MTPKPPETPDTERLHNLKSGTELHACDSSTQEAEAGNCESEARKRSPGLSGLYGMTFTQNESKTKIFMRNKPALRIPSVRKDSKNGLM